MEPHDDKERLRYLTEALLGALHFVQAFLADLPVPIAVPDFITDEGPNHESVIALDRARTLIDDEPIPAIVKQAMKDLILDWLTAYEMMVLRRMAGPAPWRLAAAEYALTRLAAIGEMIENGELDGEDDVS